MPFRNYLAGTLFVVFLIWGPNGSSSPAWVQIGCLIVIPLAVWLLLGVVWKYLEPNNETDVILKRILSGLICVGLFALAFLEATAKTHIGNTITLRTRDGLEDVGDDILLQGPNWGNVITIVIVAVLVLTFGVFYSGAKKSKDERKENFD